MLSDQKGPSFCELQYSGMQTTSGYSGRHLPLVDRHRGGVWGGGGEGGGVVGGLCIAAIDLACVVPIA